MSMTPSERQQRAIDGDIAAIVAVRQIRAAVAPLRLIAEMQQADPGAGHAEERYAETVTAQMAALAAAEEEYVADLEALRAEGWAIPAVYLTNEGA